MTTTRSAPRPAHLRPALVGLVMLGGAVGTTLRGAVADLLPTTPGSWPWATFAVNITGAFLLGLLVELLTVWSPQNPRRRALQLSLGTGLLGGFTTYSSFAVEVSTLVSHHAVFKALAYAMISVVTGFVVAFAGFWLGRRVVTTRTGTPR